MKTYKLSLLEKAILAEIEKQLNAIDRAKTYLKTRKLYENLRQYVCDMKELHPHVMYYDEIIEEIDKILNYRNTIISLS